MKRFFTISFCSRRFWIADWFMPVILLSFLVMVSGVEGAELTPRELARTELKIQELTRKALPATVSLRPRGPSRQFGTGSGVIVSEDGLILTAAHVSMEMNEQVTVIFPDGKRANGKVLGMDYSRDSGMIQITDRGKKFPFVKLGDSRSLQENDWCVALGHAGGFQHDRTPPVRLGRVILNNPKRFLMTDSALIGGDSGGPLFDLEGKLIGIHSNIGVSLSQNNHVPIASFIENWDRLKSGERFGGNDADALLDNPDRPMIGAILVDAPDQSGALVDRVVPKSPAAQAGLRRGDRIFKANDSEIRTSDSLIAAIRKHKAGETISVRVDSRGAEKSVSIKLASARKLGARTQGPRQSLRTPTPRTAAEKKALQEEFNQTMRESLEEGKLKLRDRDFEKFRSPAEFMQLMKKFQETLTPAERKRLVKIIEPSKPVPVRPGLHDPDQPLQVGEDFFREVLDAFRPSVAQASDATHLVFRGQEWKSFCTVVHPDGYALTKASEIKEENNQKLTVMLSKDKLVPARIVKTFPGHDLALLHLKDVSGLSAVRFDPSGESLPIGSLLSAAGSGPDPVAIGLVSVKSRGLNAGNKGFLGIGTSDHESGVRVTMVLREGSAGRAGVRKDDIIYRIDDFDCDTPEKLIRKISGEAPGTDVVLHLRRNGRDTRIKVKLGSRKKHEEERFRHIGDPAGQMNKMGTEVSEKSSGFRKALQTDLPIIPQQCGGPLVDLKGNVIGINIARAGRIKTYAIPADEIDRLLKPELARLTRAGKTVTQ